MTGLGELDRRLQPAARWLLKQIPRGVKYRITSVYRSPAQQLELWNNRHRNPYPVAPPGKSFHEHRRAFDMVTDPYDTLYHLGALWKSVGGRWSPEDEIHFYA